MFEATAKDRTTLTAFAISLAFHTLVILLLPVIIGQVPIRIYRVTEVEFLGTGLQPAKGRDVPEPALTRSEKSEVPARVGFAPRETVPGAELPVLDRLPVSSGATMKGVPATGSTKGVPKEDPSPDKILRKLSFAPKEVDIGEFGGKFSIEGPLAESSRRIVEWEIPEYPGQTNVEVRIKLRVKVNARGEVTYVEPLVKGDAKIEEVAIASMYKWRFSPLPTSDTDHPEEEGIVTLKFELK